MLGKACLEALSAASVHCLCCRQGMGMQLWQQSLQLADDGKWECSCSRTAILSTYFYHVVAVNVDIPYLHCIGCT